jgi:hypothetical protein
MKMKQVLLELVLIVAIFAVKANATTYPYFLGQFNNIQTTSCSDSRVSRGYALVATATYPDGAWQPAIAFNAFDTSLYEPSYPFTYSQTVYKNGKKFTGGDVTPTDVVTQVIEFNSELVPYGTITGNVLTITGLNSPNTEVCLNPDGTSCGAVFNLNGVNICY